MNNLSTRDGDHLEYYSGTTKLAKRTYFDQKTSKSVVENYSWSAAGNMLNRGTLSTYQYDRQNMLRRVTKSTGDVAENFYDEGGQRFLKTFQETGKPLVKTFYLGAGYELREKWSGSNKTAFQASKTIFGPDGQRIATFTDGVTNTSVALFSKPEDYLAAAAILTIANPKEFVTKIYLHLRGYCLMAGSLGQKVMPWFALLCFLLCFLIVVTLFVLNSLPFTVQRGMKPCIALAVACVLLFVHCHGDGENSTVYDFSGIYEGLPQGTYFYTSDHIGSSTLVTDASGNEEMRLHYTPYGSIDASASGVYNQTTNKLENTIAQPNHLITATKFALHNFDPENELYYMNARYYDPLIGSFTTADTYIDGEDSFMKGSWLGYANHMRTSLVMQA